MCGVMALIFVFSAQTGVLSSASSNSVGNLILKLLGIEIPAGQTASSVNIVFGLNIRKLAHVFVYFVLGIASYIFAVSLFGFGKFNGLHKYLIAALVALAICVFYACLDEIHQYFVEGRTPSIRDVAIDTFGFITSTAILTIIYLTAAFCKKTKKSLY